jgi:hypothetical protein
LGDKITNNYCISVKKIVKLIYIINYIFA